jgi:uncharacterized protein
MDFGNFGTVSFTKQSKVTSFVDQLFAGKVMGTVCKKCGKKFFPPRADCAYCFSSDVDWFEVEGAGKLITFTTVTYAPLGFEAEAPYAIGIVEFKDGVKVLSTISKKIDPAAVKVGMQLKVTPVKLSDTKVTYEFVTA